MDQLKTCKQCRITKSIDEFPIHDKVKNTRRAQCQLCYNDKRKISYETNRAHRKLQNKQSYYKHKAKRLLGVKAYAKRNPEKVKIWNAITRAKIVTAYKEFKKTLKCSECDENHPECLDFHHVDPKTKKYLISKSVLHQKRLQTELAKCIVLCANCHRKLHYNLKQLKNNQNYVHN